MTGTKSNAHKGNEKPASLPLDPIRVAAMEGMSYSITFIPIIFLAIFIKILSYACLFLNINIFLFKGMAYSILGDSPDMTKLLKEKHASQVQ